MKEIHFQKIFKYDPTLESKYSRYEGYKKITLQKEDPQIIEGKEEITNDYKGVFTSSLQRGIDSAMLYSKEYIVLTSLNEILFDLESLITQEEFEVYGSNLVRERFFKAFVNDQLTEKRYNIKKRMKKVFKLIKSLDDGKYLFITHSFLLKVIEQYIKHNDLFEKPEIILEEIDFSKKLFEFGEGFSFIIN